VHAGLWCTDLRKIYHLEYLGINNRIILKWTFQEVGWGGMDWIDLAQERDKWRALVNSVMNLRVP
jgi:hypothetical protein